MTEPAIWQRQLDNAVMTFPDPLRLPRHPDHAQLAHEFPLGQPASAEPAAAAPTERVDGESLPLPQTKEEGDRERRLFGLHPDPLTGLPLTTDPEADNVRSATIRR